MQSKATTVEAYLASLPEDRRAAVEAVRSVIRKNLDPKYQETMQYGMIGYSIPHRIFPAGYHCDPKEPLPFAGLASQKSHMSIYLMGLYVGEGVQLHEWFTTEWKKTGKKLDMGKACVRFKKLEDVALDVVGEAIRRMPADEYIKRYLAVLATPGTVKGESAKPVKAAAAKASKAPARRKTAKKRA